MQRTLCGFTLSLAALALTSCGGGGEPSTGTNPQVATVIVSPGEFTLEVGETQQLTATAHDEADNPLTGRSMIWASTDESIARISTTGLVTGVGEGSAAVSATTEGKSGSATVAVVPVVVSLLTFTSVAAGGAHTCALTASGAAYCWGRGESGQLGIPTPATTCNTDGGPFACSRVPIPVGGGIAFTVLTGGGAHTCGLTSDGSAYCWGSNASGQLGDNSATKREAPTAVATQLKFVSIDAGAQHTCALTGAGVAYCWGANNRGQLGNTTQAGSLMPTAVTGDHTFQMITAGGFSIGHTCALTNEGVA
jgi:alpha-tubulin suppressor-like RCC1 family protein